MHNKPPAQPVPGRRTQALLVAVLVGAAVTAASIAFVQWWTHPTLFGDRGDAFVADPAPLADSALSVAVTYPSKEAGDRVVTFRTARAHFTVNTADARATFSICRPGPDKELIGFVRADDLGRYCSALRPLDPGSRMTHTPARDGDYVVMTVQPTRPGRVRVDWVDLDYRLDRQGLYQRGTDSVALNVTVRAR